MTGPAPQRTRHGPWRLAAILALVAGAGAALWADPALLDRPEVSWPIVAVFVTLWMVPVLRDQRAARPDPASGGVIWQDRPARAGRGILGLVAGMLLGLIGGAAVLSVPGSGALLVSGPALVDRGFALVAPRGDWAGVALALAAIAAVVLALRLVRAAARSVPLLGGVIVGLVLWVPFNRPFSKGLSAAGFDLPGLVAQ
jgi:hypothetical protein